MRLAVPSRAGVRLLGEVVARMGDREVERRFGSAVVLRLAFGAMSRSYVPAAGEGFRGLLVFELVRPAAGGASTWWAMSVQGGRAVPCRGRGAGPAAVTVRVPVADFVRIALGLVDPVEPVLAGRAIVAGDLGIAARLAEMFGAQPPR